MSKLHQSIHIHDSKTRRGVPLRCVLLIDLFTPLNHWSGALQYIHQTDKPLSYLSVPWLVEVQVKQSRQLCGLLGKPAQAWYHRPCCLRGSLFSFWERQGCRERGAWRRWWHVQRATRGHSGAFSARHGQVLWSVRAGSQAGLCWHVWGLQLSAGEICTAETAGEGSRAGLGIWLSGSREAWTEMEGKLENLLTDCQINLRLEHLDLTASWTYIQYAAYEVVSVLEAVKWSHKIKIDLLCLRFIHLQIFTQVDISPKMVIKKKRITAINQIKLKYYPFSHWVLCYYSDMFF